MIEKDFRYKLAHFSDRIFLFFSKITKHLLLTFNKIINKHEDNFSVWKQDKKWERARKLSRPFHHIWHLVYQSQMRKNYDDFDLIDKTQGLQIIGGNTGSGKSTLAFDVMEKDRLNNNKAWYVNTLFEKPRYYEPANAYVRFHRYLPFDKVWSDYKMHLQLDNTYGGYVIDEIHRIFDYRLNRTNDYASKFTPFRDYAVIVRKHIKKMIGITQMDRLDIQLMYLVHMWHKPKIDIGFDYEDWMLETGLFRFKIKGWWIESFTVDTSNSSNMLVPIKKWYRKATADFEYFDTYAFSDVYDHLPKDDHNTSYT